MRNVIGLRCVSCGKEQKASADATICPHCGGILDVEYDYDYIRSATSREAISQSGDYTMWRYRPFLPVEQDTALPPLAVGWTPLYSVPRLG
ncbi:MAG: threonine synthase, partial [Oscillospiraceae bacterium]|nr:threonine synthase [Oscillospiraceae bacterium]